MRKYLPLILAALCLIFAFLFAFSTTKSARLKKLRAEPATTKGASQTEADSTTLPADESGTVPDAPDATADPTTEGDTETPDAESVSITATKLPTPTVVNMPTDSSWSLVLLNIYYKMNESYEPMVSSVAENIVLEERVAEAYKSMEAAAKADGITLLLASGYISPDRQERMFQKEVDALVATGVSQEEAEVRVAFTVLPARCSEANYGLSVDFDWSDTETTSAPAYVWLRAHAAEYGFVERYTADKEAYTHVKANPRHWRYVGTDAAAYMRDYGVSLEEYVGKTN